MATKKNASKNKISTPATPAEDRIEDINVKEELESSYLEYSLSVIVSRAIPDARDGLKPVQRRLLYAMLEGGQRSDKPHRKSVSAVGDTMKKYHPHGDQSIYDALVRLAQPWSMRVPLVDGHGNFGSRDDGPAAYRYCVTGDTRIRLADGTSPRIDSLLQLAENSEASVSLDVLDQRGRPVKASKVFNSGKHPVKKLTTLGGFSLSGSHNHPVLTLDKVAGVPLLQWKRLDEIAPGDVVCLARNAGLTDTQLTSDRLTGVLMGAWVGRGSELSAFSTSDKRFFDEVVFAYDTIVGGQRDLTERPLRRSQRTLHELDVTEMSALDESVLGTISGRDNSGVPEAVWCGSAGTKRAFLQALFESSGSIRSGENNGFTIQYSTSHHSLASDVQQLLLEFGIFATVNSFARVSGATEQRVVVSGRDQLFAFQDRVGFLTEKRAALESVLSTLDRESHKLSSDRVPFVREYLLETMPSRRGGGRSWVRANNVDSMVRWNTTRKLIKNRIGEEEFATIAPLLDSGYRYVEVTAVEDAGESVVYSVKVESESHAFVAGGFVNHNTEARLDQAAEALLASVDEDTVNMVPNFDASMPEPVVLPAGFPNLLVNGGAGIAVGMATNIPPHNLSEVIAACKHLLDNPKATTADLMKFVPGPDFPTGGLIIGKDGIKDAYTTGKGAVRVRARASIEEVSARKKGIVVTELPYNVGPERVVSRIKELVGDKKIDGISDVKDLSDRKNGLRLVIEVRTGFDPAAVLARLYKLTPLEENFGVNAVALISGKPQLCSLEDMCRAFVDHRLEVIVRRTKFRLAKAEARAHILEGLIKALADIDEVVRIIRASKDTQTARANLRKRLVVSEIQADAILEMPLRRLTSLEVSKLKADHKEILAEIKTLKVILQSPKRQREVVTEELSAVDAKFGTKRRTTIMLKDDMADVIAAVAAAPARQTGTVASPASVLELADEPCVVFATADGVARWQQGGKGAPANVVGSVTTTTRGRVGVVREDGSIIAVDVAELAEAPSKGRATLTPLSSYGSNLKAVGVVSLTATVAFGTSDGVVKRVAAEALPTVAQFQRAGSEGVSMIALEPGAVVLAAADAADDAWLVFITDDAQLLRFEASAVRPQGRTAAGMAGVKLAADAHALAFAVAPVSMESWVVATLSDGGNMKWTPLAEYPAKGRSTMGVRCQTFKKGDNGLRQAVAAAEVSGTDGAAAKRDASGTAFDGKLSRSL